MDIIIEEGDIFKHLETGKHVQVICTGSMKSEEGPWYDSVTYNVHGNNSSEPSRNFTRSKVAYLEKFVKIN